MSELDDRALALRVRTMQIIAFALIFGVLVFFAIVCFMVFGQRQGQPIRPNDELPILSLVGVAMLVGGLAASFVLATAMTRNAFQALVAAPRSKGEASDINALLGVKQMSLIASMAFLEGPAFFGCIAFMIEARPFALAIVAIPLLAMLLKFPTTSGVRAWLSTSMDLLEHMRGYGETSIQPR